MESPVSAAFRPWLTRAGQDDTHDAILVFRTQSDRAPNSEFRREESRVDRRHRFRTSYTARHSPSGRIRKLLDRRLHRDMSVGRTPWDSSTISRGDTELSLPYARLNVTREILQELNHYEDVLAVIPNQPVKLLRPTKVQYKSASRSERRSGATWGLTRLGIPRVWAQGNTRGEGIRVAVLDTGVHADHHALAHKVREFVLVDPLGRIIDTTQPFDSSSHGTHVCGTIAGGTDPDGIAIGGAPEAELVVGAVLAGDSTLDTIITGIEWAVRQGADIISMSFGFTYYEPKFEEVLRPLWDLDILPVVAIGNENHGNTSSPGNVNSAFSVGATAPSSVAPFSGGASFDWPNTPQPHVTKPDVVAPGVRTYSCVPPIQGHDYASLDGTSMATPHVAAVVALLMSAKPNARAVDIATALRNTAHHPDGRNHRPDNRWGWGEVRPSAALKLI